MRHLEDQLQKNCIRWFDYQYPSLKNRLHHSPNGGKRNRVEAAKFKAMGVRPGFPDLILLHPNKFYPFMGIELKVEKGKQSDNQKAYQKTFEELGAKYIVVRSLEDFQREVKQFLEDD